MQASGTAQRTEGEGNSPNTPIPLLPTLTTTITCRITTQTIC
jgi:hypothetical protein